MGQQNVSEIYDALFDVESNLKSSTYPIHKKLNFGEGSHVNDVYEWLFTNIDIPQNGKILDAGCGVGFGSFFLSENTNCQITGFSLSEKEVDLANSIAQKKGLEKRVKFEVKNFDNHISNKFDLIIAVESVKHSLNLDNALHNLSNALNPNGKLVIVEDFFSGDETNHFAQVMAKDWSLISVFSKSDYLNFFDKRIQSKTYDLTPFTLKKNGFKLKLRYYLLSFLTAFGQIFQKGNFWKIMRGGLALDILYNQGEMTYEVLEIEKNA